MTTMLLFLALLPMVFGSENLKIIEGDIVVDKETQDIMDGKSTLAYGGMTSRIWPNGVIPFRFDPTIREKRVKVVYEAIHEYNVHTCIRFVPQSTEKNFVRFKIGRGCYSSIGMVGRGQQDISLGQGCDHKDIAIHEMMHAVGFFHEQSRRDRDNYIKIHWDNIRKGMEFNFQKYKHGEADTFGTPYDLDSIMHYKKSAFSIDRSKPTITAIGDPNRSLGNKIGFSPIDLKEINKMYRCDDRPRPTFGPSYGPKTIPPGCVEKDPKACAYWKGIGYCHYPQIKKDCCRTCNS